MYFPAWFHIKLHNDLSDGSKNFDHILTVNRKFADSKVREISLKVFKHNAFFACAEKIFVAMLSDQDGQTRNIVVDKIMAHRQRTQLEFCPNIAPIVWHCEPESENHRTVPRASSSSNYHLRKFKVSETNIKSKTYYQTANLDDLQKEPPATMKMTDDDFEGVRKTPLKIFQPSHNQRVQRYIKIVSEASTCIV